MNGPRKTVHDRIAEELKRQEESRAALADLKARARTLERKLDVRRKIIMGAAVQAHAKLDRQFREALAHAVRAAITRPVDRAVLPEYFPEPPPAPAPPQRPVKGPGEPPSGTAPA